MFCAVNTGEARDAAQAYQVSAIPNFIAFLNGNQMTNFKGADENRLFSVMAELTEKVPQGKVMNAKKHDQLEFKLFKPTHLAPQGYQNVANLDKMKQAI